jgi:uncharacterized membrane protein
VSGYLILKTFHVLSSVLLVGTGFGTAYFFYFANRSGNVPAQAVVARLVVRADWWFTTPAAVVQPLSGLALAGMAGYPLSSTWIAASLALYVFAGACWLPVLWLQHRMARIAQHAASQGSALPPEYQRLARRWEWLGYPAFMAMLIVFWLMVAKPSQGV